jgi:hypothetical protein
MSAWQSRCLSLVLLITLPGVALPQPAPGDRDIPTGDVWFSPPDQRYPSAVAEPIPLGDPALPSGDVWPFAKAGTETTGPTLPESLSKNDPGQTGTPGREAPN